MALTKVSGGILDPGISVAGIVTATGFSGPFIGGGGINAGILTATGLDVNGNGDISGNLVIGGNLTANGDFTTLNTTLREVELLRVDANSSVAAGIITQTGAGDLLRLYDGTSQVVTVDDEGNVGLGSAIPAKKLDVNGTSQFQDDITFIDGYGNSNHIFYDKSITTLKFPSPPNTNVAQAPMIVFGDRGGTNGTKLYNDFYNTHFRHVGHGSFILSSESNAFEIKGANGSGGIQNSIRIDAGATEGVKLYSGGTQRFETVGYGVTVLGTTETQKLNVTGISTFNDNITIPDNKKLILGSLSGRQLHLYHNTSGSSNHVIESTSSSNHLIFKATTINPRSDYYSFRNYAHNQDVFLIDADGQTKLFYNGNNKLTTTGYGVTVTGITSATSFTASEGGITGQYTRNQIKWDRNNYNYIDCTNDSGQFAIRMGSSQTAAFSIDTSADTIFSSNRKIKMSSDKLQLYHTGSLAIINNSTGDLDIRGDVIRIKKYDASKTMASFIAGGQAEFNYDTTRRLHTSPTGIVVTGEVAASQDYPNFRPTLDLNFAAEKKLDPRITYQRTGPASFTNEFGKLIKVGDNAPRFDHNFRTGESLGLLIEESSTNISRFSEKASGTTNWNQFGSITENIIEAPDGSMTADKLEAPSSGYGLINLAASWTANQPHTFSIFAKSAEWNRIGIRIYDGTSYFIRTNINLDTGETVSGNNGAGTLKVDKFANGWWRISVSGTPVSTYGYGSRISVEPHNTAIVQNNDPSSSKEGIYIWGWQWEQKAFPTSYIATNGAEVTRGADTTVIDGEDFNEFFDHNGIDTNDYQGTLISFVELDSSTTPSAGRYNKIQLELNNDNKISFAQMGGGTPYIHGIISYGGSIQIDGGSSGSTFPTVLKQGLAFAKNNAAFCYNGNTVHTDNSVNVGHPSFKYTQLTIGGSPSKAHLKKITYYNSRISDTQLRNLTS